MRIFSNSDFDTMIRDAKLLEADRYGPKVYATTDDRIVKLFRTKRRFSSDLWSPFAIRFARNAALLKERGLRSPEVVAVGKVPHLDRQIVVYEKLPGVSLRNHLREISADAARNLVEKTGAFIDEVQGRGVLFRSFHFGNILVMPDGGFGLIDVLDIRCGRSPLGLRKRKRNLKHLTRYQEDRDALFRHWDAFCDGYLARSREGASGLCPQRLEAILREHRAIFPQAAG